VKKRISILAAAVLFAAFASACAQPSDPKLIVDLKTVVSEGSVQPINGLSTAGQPTAAALKVFAESGYKTVIDLRGKREKRGFDESRTIEELGMRYITLPIRGSEAINFDNARLLDQLIEQADGPILVHCASGNRVGALLALRESLHGEDAQAALLFGKSSGLTRLEPRVVEVLARK
jgi:uncharacterized protein (TIGR01244 family)